MCVTFERVQVVVVINLNGESKEKDGNTHTYSQETEQWTIEVSSDRCKTHVVNVRCDRELKNVHLTECDELRFRLAIKQRQNWKKFTQNGRSISEHAITTEYFL